jgi:hypothetical protein
MRAATILAGIMVASSGVAAHAQSSASGYSIASIPDAPKPLRGLRAENDVAAPFGKALGPDFRLRTSVGLFTGPSVVAPGGNVRQRIASSMFDFYPMGVNSGFHFSGGARYYRRDNFAIDQQTLTHGLLYSPNWHTGGGSRAGFKRFTPAATMGYTSTIGDKLLIGVEGGALMGRATNPMPRAMERALTEHALGFSQPHGLNEVASFVVGMRF